MQFSDSQLSKWAQDYEKELSAKFDFFCDRISIPIVSGVGTYTLPEYVTNIRAVLYLGKELHPKGFRASVIIGDTPMVTSQSLPYEYQFSGLGLRVLRLLPTPGLDIPEYSGDLFTLGADQNSCIVEFYRTADYASDIKMPAWLRRAVLRTYVCWKAFSMEGPSQDLRASAYYSNKMNEDEFYLSTVKSNMFRSYHRILSTQKMIARQKPGRPVLPPNFGFPVNG